MSSLTCSDPSPTTSLFVKTMLIYNISHKAYGIKANGDYAGIFSSIIGVRNYTGILR